MCWLLGSSCRSSSQRGEKGDLERIEKKEKKSRSTNASSVHNVSQAIFWLLAAAGSSAWKPESGTFCLPPGFTPSLSHCSPHFSINFSSPPRAPHQTHTPNSSQDQHLAFLICDPSSPAQTRVWFFSFFSWSFAVFYSHTICYGL